MLEWSADKTAKQKILASSLQTTGQETHRITSYKHAQIVTILKRCSPIILTYGLQFGKKRAFQHCKVKHNSYRKREHFHFTAEKGRKGNGDTWYIRRRESPLGLYCSDNTQMKKYKMFHRTFPGYTNIKRHSTVMLRHHKGMGPLTSATDAQAKLLHSVKHNQYGLVRQIHAVFLFQKQRQSHAAAHCPKYQSIPRRPFSSDEQKSPELLFTRTLGNLEIVMNLPKIGRHQ